MKTQIIALSAHEDYLSVRDKLNWSQTGRVLITWPDEQPILSQLDLVIIQRHCFSKGITLAVVTENQEIRRIAKQLGIAVFTSTVEAQTARWRTVRRRRSPRQHRYGRADLINLQIAAQSTQTAWTTKGVTRWVALIIGIIAVLALLGFIVPSARLALQPETQLQSIQLEVITSPQIKEVNLSGSLPTYPVRIVVEGRANQPATGIVSAGYKPAVGGVQFTNLTESALTIPAGTVVSTLDNPPIRFSTNSPAKLSAGVGSNLILSVTAMTPGSAGNLPVNSLVAIEGTLGLSLSATNLAATHGGSDSLVRGPSFTDQQTLRKQLSDSLFQTAQEELQTNLPEGDMALVPTLTHLQTLEEMYTPEVGQPGEQIELILRLEFVGQAITSDDLQILATPLLDSKLPDGFIPLAEPLTTSIISITEINPQGETKFTIKAERRLQAVLSPDRVIDLMRGADKREVSQKLMEALPLASVPQIVIHPDWWPRLPLNPFRIQVVLENQQ